MVDIEENGVRYRLDNGSGEATVTGYTGSLPANLVLPNTVSNGGTTYDVTSIERAAFYGSSLISIVIPATVRTIGDTVFTDITSLQSVTFDDGSQLTSIEFGVFFGSRLTSITIPNTVTSIGQSAFETIPTLQTVTFQPGSQLTSIGIFAFNNSGLTSIVIPDGTTSIGEAAFSNNPLTNITLPSSLGPLSTSGDTFANTPLQTLIYAGNTISNADFYREGVPTTAAIIRLIEIADNGVRYRLDNGNGQATVRGFTPGLPANLVLPNSVSNGGTTYNVTSIGEYAFYNSNLENITIPTSVRTIGAAAFAGTPSGIARPLQTVIFEPGSQLTSIGEGAFSFQVLLSSIDIPASVTSIGDSAFVNTGSLQTVIFENGSQLTSIGDSAFSQSGLTSVVIPANVGTIGDNAFFQINSLQTVTFEPGSRLTSIGDSAFLDSGLTSVVIPASVTSIGDQAFDDTPSLQTVTFEPGSQLSSIGDSAFSQSGLTSLVIPASVTSIGGGAFFRTTSLQTVSFEPGSRLTSIGDSAFAQSGLTSVIIPESVTSIGGGAFDLVRSLQSVTFEPGSRLTSIGSLAFGRTGIGSIIIPASVTSIGEAAFGSTNSLQTVTFETGSQLSSIGQQAFVGSGLTSIVIPANVRSIGPLAFGYIPVPGQPVSSLRTVTFEVGSQLNSIGSYAFYNSGLTSLVVPNGTTSIGEAAFLGATSLTSLSLPASLGPLSTSGNTFANTSQLRTLTYSGTTISNADFYREGISRSVRILRSSDQTTQREDVNTTQYKNRKPGGIGSSVAEYRRLNAIARTWGQPSKNPKVPDGSTVPSVFARNTIL